MTVVLRRAAGLARSAAEHPAFVPALFVWLCALALGYGLTGGYDEDEIETVHTAWKILNEGAIYRDFFQHHHPLLYYLLAPLILVGGDTLWSLYTSEAFAFGMLAVTTGIVHRTALRLYDRPTAFAAVFLLLAFPYFLPRASEIRPDTLQILLLAASFHFLVAWEQDRRRPALALSGTLLALSFLALQKAVFSIALFGLVHLYWLLTKRMTWRDFVLFWFAFLAPAMLALGALVHMVGFRDYLELNWLMNMEMGYAFVRLRYLGDLAPFLVLTAAAAFTGFGRHQRVALFLGIGLLVSVAFAIRPYQQWLLPAAPFMALAAAPAVTRFPWRWAGRAVLIFLIVVVASGRAIELHDDRPAKLRVYKHVLAATGPEDVVLNFHPEINLFRRDAHWFWTCPHCLEAYQRVRPYDLDFARLIREKEPALIRMRPGPGGKPRVGEILDRSGAAGRYERKVVEGHTLYVRKRAP